MELVVIQEDTQHQAVEALREDKAEADIQEHHQELQEAMADHHMQEHTWPGMLTQATP